MRAGDPTVSLEVRIVRKNQKSYTIEVVTSEDENDVGERFFLPYSQTIEDTLQPDPEGRVIIEASEWWYKKRQDFKLT